MGTRDEEKIGSQKVREKEEEVEARWTNSENKERKKGRKRENWMDGWMGVFGRGASPRMGGPLGKASGEKKHRWFVNLLLGVDREKPPTKNIINQARPGNSSYFLLLHSFLGVCLFCVFSLFNKLLGFFWGVGLFT